MRALARLVILLLLMMIVGCVKVPEKIEIKTPDLKDAGANLGSNLGENVLGIRDMRQAIEARDRTIQEQKDRIRDLELIAQGKRPPEPALKFDSFPVILHSEKRTAREALDLASNPSKGEWIVVQTNPDGRPVYTHPRQFGSRIVAVWWTDTRDDRVVRQKWGALIPTIGGPKANQVVILSSAQSDAGHREGMIHILYIE